MQRLRGFTLIELMVAISIMATMTVMAWRSIDSMTRSVTLTQQTTALVLSMEAGLGQWVTDLDAMQATDQTSAMQWDGRTLRLTRRNSADDASGLVVVAWTLRKTADASVWVRWQSPAVRNRMQWQTAWQAALTWAQSPGTDAQKQEVSIARLEQWQVLFFVNGAWVAPPPLAAEAAAAPPPAMPDGVRLVLTVAGGHPFAGLVQRDWARPTLTPGVAP